MAVESAKQDVQVSVGKDFVIMGGDRVEVSADGKKVTAYTNDGVETKAAASGAAVAQWVSISADFNTVVLNGATIERAADGHLVISSSGTIITKPAPANDTAAKATHEIGAIEITGEHIGEIYGGIYPADYKPIWFSRLAPNLMDHYAAAAWAKEQGGALPTRKQGDYLDSIKDKGAFKTIFNHSGSFPAGYVWLAEPYPGLRDDAWCQRLSDGDQGNYYRNGELPVLSVRR
jgi:hypothetical protein